MKVDREMSAFDALCWLLFLMIGSGVILAIAAGIYNLITGR